MVDIGIFDSSGNGLGNIAGFRGWSGGARSSFTLAATDGTPGYLPGPITPGRWRIALGPYQIQRPGTPYEVTVTLHLRRARARAFVANPAPRVVDGQGRRLVPRRPARPHRALRRIADPGRRTRSTPAPPGLDFIGTSEHNTSSAQRTWGDHSSAPPTSWSSPARRSPPGPVTGSRPLDSRRRTWIDWRYRPEDELLARFTKVARRWAASRSPPTPTSSAAASRWELRLRLRPMDAIEVWNGPWTGLNAVANKALTQWHSLLAKGVFKPAVGNSDTHKQSQQIGLAQTVVRADSLSADAIIAGYRGGHSWITESSAVELTFSATLGDVTGECGDRVPSTAKDQVAVHLEVTGVDGTVATLVGPKGVLATAPRRGRDDHPRRDGARRSGVRPRRGAARPTRWSR